MLIRDIKKMNIIIVGLGVIGASYAIGLKKMGCENIYGVDTNKDTLTKAVQMKIIKEGFTDGASILSVGDIIILAIYPKDIINFVINSIKFFKKNSIITDVGGIKSKMIGSILEILPNDIDFIFGHPMAGREKKGIDYATDEVFQGANYIITPTFKNKKENIELWEKIILDMGFGQVKKITPELHDKIIGYTSQLTHIIAVALMNSEKKEYQIKNFIGDSFRDLTRIAKINEDLWTELFIENRENLISSIEDFQKQLENLKISIINEDESQLKKLLKSSTDKREMLDK